MKTVILAGGYGSRLFGQPLDYPKPLLEIGGMPILWHIMKLYAHHGFREFIICAGYKQHMIKSFFSDYFLRRSDVTFDFTGGRQELTFHHTSCEPWKVTVVDTGLHTMTGGRIKRVREHLGDQPFLLTYADGLADIDLGKVVEFHRAHGKLVTVSAYAPAQRFGILDVENNGRVTAFREKERREDELVNIGFMVCQPEFLDRIEDDSTVLEKGPLQKAARDGQLMAYRHDGFWQCMDTPHEKALLESLWEQGTAPWKVWE